MKLARAPSLGIGYWNLLGDWPLEMGYCYLALSLFMFRVFTDDPDDPLSLHDLTLVANLFNRSPDFHGIISPGTRFFPWRGHRARVPPSPYPREEF